MKAAIYARYSTDRQNESSIADQVRVCEEFAVNANWTVTQVFADEGISGAALGNRPGARSVLEAALAGDLDVVLVCDLSRLSRSQADLPKMIDRLTARGVRVIGIQDGYDSLRKGHKLQAGLSGIIGEAFRDMIRDRTHAALETRAKNRQPTGGKAYGYSRNVVVPTEADVVVRIFTRFADGASYRTIAGELNAEGIPSPGASWKRTNRRRAGWMGSTIRAILKNERYTGLTRWNTSEWRKDPDTGKRRRVARPRHEWLEHTDESLRIVSDERFSRAQRRTRLGSDARVRSGGKPRYLLSGLLQCAECGAHYVIADPRSYACSSHINGRACDNGIRIKREDVERIVLAPVRDGLLEPGRVERMAKEIQRDYQNRLREMTERAAEAPKELQDLDARITRLRGRLTAGDPDMASDEIQAAIDRAEEKRRELIAIQPAARQAHNRRSPAPGSRFVSKADRGRPGRRPTPSGEGSTHTSRNI